MVGLRVQVGMQSVEKAPSYLEIFGRSKQVGSLAVIKFLKIMWCLGFKALQLRILLYI